MALNCGMNVLPDVLKTSGWGFSWNAISASNQALSNAEANARHIVGSWGANYPCPGECPLRAYGIKPPLPLPTPTTNPIHIGPWTFYMATVTLTFQPIMYCINP